MGHTLPKFGESGWGVSRTGSKEVEGVMREKQDVWVIEGSFSFSGRKSGRRSQVSNNCVIMKNK